MYKDNIKVVDFIFTRKVKSIEIAGVRCVLPRHLLLTYKADKREKDLRKIEILTKYLKENPEENISQKRLQSGDPEEPRKKLKF